ncbi:ClpP family protease [Symbioplanes lichenis]|uniref:ClpP family protease n=1 Tax=Symbioplanes lichenis TaxID=1629072 RepID=UPI002739D47A|nr:ATP-dependent Clp protease proteolytic subunit [Actinoplanes lichenis]
MQNTQPYGFQLFDELLKERIVFLGTEVTDESANTLCAQLLLLSAADPVKDIQFYINSPGGSVTAGMAVYDTMRFIPNDVATIGFGMAASMGQFLLTAGTPGKRYALPHARIMMHQASGGIGGTAADVTIQAENMLFVKRQMHELIASHSGQSVERIAEDSDRDRWFTADQAREYGLIDTVITEAAAVPALT